MFYLGSGGVAQSLRNVTKLGMNGADTLLQQLTQESLAEPVSWEPEEKPNLNLRVGYPESFLTSLTRLAYLKRN